MKVVIISMADFGGAGLCAYRIHKSLQSIGVESTMLVALKRQKDDSVVRVGNLKTLTVKIVNKLLRTLGLKVTESNRIGALGFSSPRSVYRIDKHPAVKDADLIHLHWVDNFLDYESFFKNVSKPIVWTLHDENLFFGIAHYSQTAMADNKYEKKYYKMKLGLVSRKKNLNVVFLSKEMYRNFSGHEMIKSATKTIVNNAVDMHEFVRKERTMCRKKYGFSDNDIVLIFVAHSINDPRKGLKLLLEAIDGMGDERLKVLAVGNKGENVDHPKMLAIGSVTDSNELSQAYSAADYFVMPSSQEAFAQTPLEAMACGIPVVVFPVSGTEELITEENGVRCKAFSVEALKEGLHEAMTRKYNAEQIRNDVATRFSPTVIAHKYKHIYDETLEHCYY